MRGVRVIGALASFALIAASASARAQTRGVTSAEDIYEGPAAAVDADELYEPYEAPAVRTGSDSGEPKVGAEVASPLATDRLAPFTLPRAPSIGETTPRIGPSSAPAPPGLAPLGPPSSGIPLLVLPGGPNR